MDRLAQDLRESMEARDTARAIFDARLAQVRQDLDARGLGGRIADKVGEEAREVFHDALEVADDSKGVIAGTVGALGLWLLRKPIIAWVTTLLEDDPNREDSKAGEPEAKREPIKELAND